MTEVKNAVKEYLASIGSRGGSSGTGAKKRRPKSHYQRMAKLSHAKRKAKKRKAKAEHSDV
jgi:hypothetical protein